MIERTWAAVPPVLFTQQGTAYGQIYVASTSGFKVQMQVVITSPAIPPQTFVVQRVINQYSMLVGPVGSNISARSNMSAYDTTAYVYSEAQARPSIPAQSFTRAIYDEEPTVAIRAILVDQFGNYVNSSSGSSANPNPNSQTIINYDVTSTSEFSVQLPNNTMKYVIRVRDSVAPLIMAFNPGGTASNFISIARGSNFESPTINSAQTILYFLCSKIGAVVEIMAWYQV